MNSEVTNKLFIVDDDPAYMLELVHILESEYTIYTSKDGKTAAQKAEKLLPDLILLDILMPGINGFEVLAELKKNNSTMSIPVIFITGLGSSEDEQKGLLLGAVDYIVKPFNSTIVKNKIQNQIKIVNLQKELEAIRNS